MIITHISDTHGQEQYFDLKRFPFSDVVVHSGDFTTFGYKHEVVKFIGFAKKLISLGKCRHFVFIAGNHDRSFDSKYSHEYKGERGTNKPDWLIEILSELKHTNIYYLENSGVEIEGIKFWGSPVTPWFHGEHWAFNRYRGDNIDEVWKRIPFDVDVLITHGPPSYKHDFTVRTQEYVGCENLRFRVKEIKPALHCFGHIHEGYGYSQDEYTTYSNGSQCTEYNSFIHRPLMYVLEEKTKKVRYYEEDLPF